MPYRVSAAGAPTECSIFAIEIYSALYLNRQTVL
jgi:hypothetical protein